MDACGVFVIFTLAGWDHALGLEHLDQRAAVVAVNAAGDIVHTYQGDDIKPGTLELLERLGAAAA